MIFELHSHYAMAKEGCYVCGASNNLINTELQIEGEGILAICTTCLLEALHVAQNSEDCTAELPRAIVLEAEVKQLQKDKRELSKRLRTKAA